MKDDRHQNNHPNNDTFSQTGQEDGSSHLTGSVSETVVGSGSESAVGFEPSNTPIGRRDLIGMLGGAVLGLSALSAGITLSPATEAYAAPAGTIGLTFDSVTEVLAGQAVTGRVYTYDLGGADALTVSIDYDTSVFASIAFSAPSGVSILAEDDSGGRVSVVLTIDPAIADYSNLLTVTATAGSAPGAGQIQLSRASAAKAGVEYVQMGIGADNNTLAVTASELDLDEITIATLSRALMYFQVATGDSRWAGAAQYDLNKDGIVDVADYVKIANIILDLQNNIKLKFHADGSFKILSISDYQDYINATTRPTVDQRTVTLLNKMLDTEQPDLVVIVGDLMSGGGMNGDLLQEYYRQMVEPLEQHKTPWLVTFGNHDEDAGPALSEGWNKVRQLEYFRTFPHNVNRATMSGAVEYESNGHTNCVGDMYTLIYDADGGAPLYNLWAIDSNRYQDKGITRPLPYQNYFQNGTWDWIRPAQVDWYYRSSQQLEARYGKLNALMFFHIPLQEWSNMYADSAKFGVTGRRDEGECPGNVNSGLYSRAKERGDVKGIFVGHDHVNDYIGDYYGIRLAYDGSIGYATYGDKDLKGGCLIELNTSDLSTFTSKTLYAKTTYGL